MADVSKSTFVVGEKNNACFFVEAWNRGLDFPLEILDFTT
jgi:hypothetical protein